MLCVGTEQNDAIEHHQPNSATQKPTDTQHYTNQKHANTFSSMILNCDECCSKFVYIFGYIQYTMLMREGGGGQRRWWYRMWRNDRNEETSLVCFCVGCGFGLVRMRIHTILNIYYMNVCRKYVYIQNVSFCCVDII